jgi:hypothetical protein
LVALLFAICGGFLLREGWLAAHSMVGSMDYYSKGIAYKIAGHIRFPGFALIFAGGVLFLFASWWTFTTDRRSIGRRSKRRRRRN